MDNKTQINSSKLEMDLSEKLKKVLIDADSDKISKNVKNNFCNNTKNSLADSSLQNSENSTKLLNGISSSSSCNHEETRHDNDNDGEILQEADNSSPYNPYLKCTLTPFECESIQISRDDELFNITYKVYESELELPSIMKLIQKDLSEVRKDIHTWNSSSNSVQIFFLYAQLSRTQSTLIDISSTTGQSYVT